MPTVFGHIIAGSAIGFSNSAKKNLAYWLFIVILSVLPDFDVIFFKFGFSYNDNIGHRGLFHSLLFCLSVAMILYLITSKFNKQSIKEQWKVFLIYFWVLLSHPLLDCVTNGGLGVGLLMPFDDTRFFYKYRPIKVSPFGLKNLLTQRGLVVLKSEALWIGIPSFVLITISILINFKKKNKVQDTNL